MVEFGKISWEGKTPRIKERKLNAQKAFDATLELSQTKFSDINLANSCEKIEHERKLLKDTYNKFILAASEEPFLTYFNIWIKDTGHLQPEILVHAKALIENNLLGTHDSDGLTWTLEKASRFDQTKVIEAIRCQKWPIRLREAVVRRYIDFIDWLSAETHGFIDPISDPDRIRAKNRKLSFNQFIEFLDAIPNEKSQLVAKILYFSKSATLDSILGLEISNVDFHNRHLIFGTLELETYPEHIFSEIKALIGNRKEGLVFTGRQDAPLNEATIFRHFTEAAKLAGLGESFGPRKLIATN